MTIETPDSAAPPLVVFADDWGRHPSGIQHLVRHLLPSRQVLWVNTIGTRKPRLDRATLRRGWEKLRHWGHIGQPADLHPNLTVLNPIMWPSFASAASRRLNRWLLLRQLSPKLRRLPTPPVAVTKTAVVADLLGRLPVRRWMYYCVDDFSQWPGLDQGTLRRMEEELVPQADVVIAASEPLRVHLASLGGPPPRLLTHGFDPEHWSSPDPQTPPELADLPAPLVVFWGLIDRRLDMAWLAHLAAELTEGTIVLIGPESDPDPALLRLPRTRCLRAVPFAVLPAVARAAAVLVMPYADLPVCRAMQPLKLKEYLASGKPVVVRDLPSTREWADCLDIAITPAEFASAVRRRLAEGTPVEQQAARKRLDAETWARKAEQFARWIDADIPAGLSSS
jgi:glycosyltransferase involved in cell wall biosynthesis